LSRGDIAVVLCDCDLPDGSWLDILNLISSQADPPLLIVAARTVDRRLWAEVLNLGGFDVIAKPFDAREVEHVVKSAWPCRYSRVRARHFAAAG
jgi:DNA-binding response OmpR family regulator